MDFDLLFRGGDVLDGLGSPVTRGDVGVRDGRIVAVGDIPADAGADRVIDATGLTIAPGFIDIHTHSDVSLLVHPAGESKVRQGVTTEVIGNCGFSAFPIAPAQMEFHNEHLSGVDQDTITPTWTDLEGYADALREGGIALNVAPLVGHGCLRIAGMGLEEEPTAGQLTTLANLLDEAMEQGAFGLSTGLTYVPSMYGSTSELVELSKVVARHGGFYATHARVTPKLLDSIEEAATIGRESGVRVQYSHAAINNPGDWGRAGEVVDFFDSVRNDGVDFAYDVYPYDASSSPLTQYLPAWVQAGGLVDMSDRLRDRSTRLRAIADLNTGWYGGIPWLWDRVIVSRSTDLSLVGRTLEDIAASEAVEPAELVLRLCEEHGNDLKVVLFYRTEEDVECFLAGAAASVGSDGNAVPLNLPAGDRPHPRFFGCFPRVLGRYVRERKTLGLPEAIQKMTSAPAARLGLTDRGRLAEGLAADLVVFATDRVRDTATFVDPCHAPEGISYVAVGGSLVVDGGVQTDVLPGQVLRHA